MFFHSIPSCILLWRNLNVREPLLRPMWPMWSVCVVRRCNIHGCVICSNAVIGRGADLKYCLVGNGQQIEAEGEAHSFHTSTFNMLSLFPPPTVTRGTWTYFWGICVWHICAKCSSQLWRFLDSVWFVRIFFIIFFFYFLNPFGPRS